MISGLRTESHRECESLRAELLEQINAVSLKVEAFRSEFNARLEKLNNTIDSQYKWIISLLVLAVMALFGILIRDFFAGK